MGGVYVRGQTDEMDRPLGWWPDEHLKTSVLFMSGSMFISLREAASGWPEAKSNSIF